GDGGGGLCAQILSNGTEARAQKSRHGLSRHRGRGFLRRSVSEISRFGNRRTAGPNQGPSVSHRSRLSLEGGLSQSASARDWAGRKRQDSRTAWDRRASARGQSNRFLWISDGRL